ncbi:hypothetical protein BDK51DRAFT_44913, partial [Blyttiomyces helicus]
MSDVDEDHATHASDPTGGDEGVEYEVEKITGKHVEDGGIYYEVKWSGYKKKSWQPVEDLVSCTEAIAAYEKKAAAVKT